MDDSHTDQTAVPRTSSILDLPTRSSRCQCLDMKRLRLRQLWAIAGLCLDLLRFVELDF